MQENSRGTILLLWSHLGLNQGPPDYESGATNQLSYGTRSLLLLFNLTGSTVEHKALIFGDAHLLLGQFRNG